MTFEELDQKFPNGFDDAEKISQRSDYRNRAARLELHLRGNQPDSSDSQGYRDVTSLTRVVQKLGPVIQVAMPVGCSSFESTSKQNNHSPTGSAGWHGYSAFRTGRYGDEGTGRRLTQLAWTSGATRLGM
jgi:hypothetical protein